MSVLQALDRYYHRMAARGEAEAPGWSREKIGWAIVLSADGAPVDVQDMHEASGKKRIARLLDVPAAVKRTMGISPNLLWDKTAYVLGRTAGEGKRTAEERARFRDDHLILLKDERDEGLAALRRFLENWTPDWFDAAPFSPEMLDANVVFRLAGDSGYLHDRPAARRLVEARTQASGDQAFCLVTGQEAPIQRLHPPIKGVQGAQTAGAALVSFNLEAFTSYNKAQGANAPTSQAAAFRYGAALNRMLDRGSANRLPRPVGDATVVFWADAEDEEKAAAAEDVFLQMFEPALPSKDADPQLERDLQEAEVIRQALRPFSEGRPVKAPKLELARGVRFHILGLSPNAARLSVRFWITDDFEAFARRLADHHDDLNIEPKPWRATPPSVSRLLVRTTALMEKFDNIPPLLAGEVMRSVLTGAHYPRTLLSAAIIRLRAGDDPTTGWHAAAIRAVLVRERRLKNPDERNWLMSLEKDRDDPPYQLGRLFAALEIAQKQALGQVNATIRDRYFGAASATPAHVFPLLLRGAQSHLGKLRKDHKGGWIEREIEDITAHLPPELPRSLRLDAQGRFAIGYYHQRKAQFAGRPAGETDNEEGAGDVD
ncbi:type I-C CRISPR-associated protein Cas8c/Csd1 [Brevundimonas diminuta]|uniref:type I-C CRISPR-associated protein Cas8c/Csd1 n=1 Tax=Brevundimonas diminuta TaxID=293 RepID=UPI003CFD73D3